MRTGGKWFIQMSDRRMKKGSTLVEIGIFVLFICMPCLSWPIVKPLVGDRINNENRVMAEKPILEKETFFEYPTLWEQYFADALPYRDFLIEFDSVLKYYGGESASESVIIGEDGWLFYEGELNDYKRNNLYSEEKLEMIKNDVLETQKYFDEKGIEFILFIAPNKASIYGDNYMPEYIQHYNDISRTQQLVDYVKENTDVTIIFPEKELKQMSELYPDKSLYFHLDTHWNYLGGYFGAKELLEELDVEIADYAELEIREVNEPCFFWNGYDLANMMGMTNILTKDVNYVIEEPRSADVTYIGDVRNDIEVFNTFSRSYSNALDERKVFFCRDSFGEAMMPFLASHFKEVYSPHAASITIKQIEEEKPDVFILELVERGGIDYLLYPYWKE